MTSDLNDREDQIVAYKKREAKMNDFMESKRKQTDQDQENIRKLSEKLNQVMMDKEDLKDTIESLRVNQCH